MSLAPPQGLKESDFETIEDAVLETARGRWFLREFARRARAADTSRLLEAVSRIEGALMGQAPALDAARLDAEDHLAALDERQARLSEIGWMLRERGYDGDICALIEKEARAVGRLAATLRGGGAARRPEPARIEAQRAIAAPAETPTDALPPPAVRSTVVGPPPAETLHPPQAARPEPHRPWREAAADALAPVDRMSIRDRLALFA